MSFGKVFIRYSLIVFGTLIVLIANVQNDLFDYILGLSIVSWGILVMTISMYEEDYYINLHKKKGGTE